MVTIADRANDLQRTMEALLSGGSGWPHGVIDVARKRLESVHRRIVDVRQGNSPSCRRKYQALLDRPIGPTSVALMIEIARRSTLSGHERMAEARERASDR